MLKKFDPDVSYKEASHPVRLNSPSPQLVLPSGPSWPLRMSRTCIRTAKQVHGVVRNSCKKLMWMNTRTEMYSLHLWTFYNVFKYWEVYKKLNTILKTFRPFQVVRFLVSVESISDLIYQDFNNKTACLPTSINIRSTRVPHLLDKLVGKTRFANYMHIRDTWWKLVLYSSVRWLQSSK